jgi:single-strand DNA-binding protein
MQESNITIVGTVVQDPKFSITKSGNPLCALRVAVNSRKFDKDSATWVDSDTNYFTINCWRYLAENVAQSVQKGDPVIATGKLRVREWKTAEKSGISVELEANSVGHDLNRGSSTFSKNRKPLDEGWEPEGMAAAS